MPSSISITAAAAEPELLDLPWHLPLEDWPKENISALPKGLSRHTVIFAHLNDHVIAIKETLFDLAKREYEMLRKLEKLDIPCVEAFAIIQEREDLDGKPLPAVLITRHLKFSLPYRAMWSQGLREQTANRLVDALAPAAGAAAPRWIFLGGRLTIKHFIPKRRGAICRLFG